MERLLQQNKINHRPLFLITSIVLVLFLFFIDEGYYNFNWMKSFGSWIVFTIYAVVLFFGQYLTHSIIKKYDNIDWKIVIET